MGKELIIESEQTNNVVQIRNYDDVYAIAKGIIEDNPAIIISSKEELALAKEKKAKLNKIVNLIKRRRIDTSKDIIGLFEEQCKTLEKLFETASNEFNNAIKTYEDSLKTVVVEKPKIYVATLKFTDVAKCDLLTKFCLDNGIELTIK